MTVQAHADAILALLRADTQLVVFPAASGTAGSGGGTVPDGARPPYVSVHINVRRPGAEALTGASERVTAYAYAHCVGGNDIAARAVAQRVAAALLDQTPTVPGRRCWPIRQDDSRPPVPDESTGVLVVDQVDVYRLDSIAA